MSMDTPAREKRLLNDFEEMCIRAGKAEARVAELEARVIAECGHVDLLAGRAIKLEARVADQTNELFTAHDAITRLRARVAELEARVRPVNGYGIALMMIAEGVDDPRQFAKDTLAKWRPIIEAGIHDRQRADAEGAMSEQERDNLIDAGKDKDKPAQPEPPYGEWCRNPNACSGKGYCPLDPTCGD